LIAGRAVALSGVLRGDPGHLEDGLDVVAVDAYAREPVALRPLDRSTANSRSVGVE